MSLIKYNTGTPVENGVYACRIPMEPKRLGLLEDKFLLWYNEEWSYLHSDSKYRDVVLGWVGPLQRKMP